MRATIQVDIDTDHAADATAEIVERLIEREFNTCGPVRVSLHAPDGHTFPEGSRTMGAGGLTRAEEREIARDLMPMLGHILGGKHP